MNTKSSNEIQKNKEVKPEKSKMKQLGKERELSKAELQVEKEKKQLLEKIIKAEATKDRVALFSKVMDNYGVEALVSVIPELGDAGTSIIATLYLLYEAKKIGLGRKGTIKILGAQGIDFAIGTVPVIGDIADFFFKSNRYSKKVFESHVAKLKKEALKKGIDKKTIADLDKQRDGFVLALDKLLPKGKKNKSRNSSEKKA